MGRASVLDLECVSKSYDSGLRVLDGVDMRVLEGESVAVAGPSGSGKTSLLQICGLVDKAFSGVVRFGDKDFAGSFACSEAASAEVGGLLGVNTRFGDRARSRIGFVFQFHYLLPEFSVVENLEIPQKINGFADEAFNYELLERLGIADRAKSRVWELSGGQRQRVAVARALAHKPRLVLADEPTGNLDTANALEVFRLFLECVRDFGMSLVMVTHNSEHAGKLDRVMKVEMGRLTEG